MKLAFYKAFQNQATWLDIFIALVTFGRYSHVEIVFSDGMSFSISPREKVCRFKRIDFNPDNWDFIELVVTKKEEDYIRAMEYKYLHCTYDYIGAMTSATPICLQVSSEMFCSELATELIRNSLSYRRLRDGCRYSPNALYKILGGGRWQK
ncbi:MAG: hypothetical protein PHE73_03650 [Sulfurovaceae bacterium]|nr:hypothetical protein [Sulfurovaceae bacterium]